MTQQAAVIPTLGRAGHRKSGPRLSRILRQTARNAGDRRVTIGDLLAALGDRSYGAFMLIFALPNVVPIPLVGLSALLGLPLVFLAAQLAGGWRLPWLPAWITRRSLTGGEFRAVAAAAVPIIARAERLLRPRWSPLTSAAAERIIGVVCLVMAVILFLPIPFANLLPAAAISLMALGILQKDGLAVILGALTALVAFTVASGVIYAIIKTAIFLVTRVLLR